MMNLKELETKVNELLNIKKILNVDYTETKEELINNEEFGYSECVEDFNNNAYELFKFLTKQANNVITKNYLYIKKVEDRKKLDGIESFGTILINKELSNIKIWKTEDDIVNVLLTLNVEFILNFKATKK